MSMKNRASKIKAMQMPKKPMAADEADLDLESLDSMPVDESAQNGDMLDESGYMGPLDDAETSSSGELSHIDDKQLLDELKKRGLMSKHSPLGKAAESDLVSDEMDYSDLPDESAMQESEESPHMQALEKRLGIEKKMKPEMPPPKPKKK